MTGARSVMHPTDTAPPGVGMLTGADGTFVFQNLAAATYLMCVQAVPSRQYVASCEWNLKPPEVKVTDGQAVTGVRLTIAKGVRIEFQIQDSKQLLPAPDRQTPGTFFRAAVLTSNGLLHQARLAWHDDKTVTYALTVPVNTALKLNLASNTVQLSDDKGAPVAQQAAATAVQFAPGAGTQTFHFSASGGKN